MRCTRASIWTLRSAFWTRWSGVLAVSIKKTGVRCRCEVSHHESLQRCAGAPRRMGKRYGLGSSIYWQPWSDHWALQVVQDGIHPSERQTQRATCSRISSCRGSYEKQRIMKRMLLHDDDDDILMWLLYDVPDILIRDEDIFIRTYVWYMLMWY